MHSIEENFLKMLAFWSLLFQYGIVMNKEWRADWCLFEFCLKLKFWKETMRVVFALGL